MLIATVRQVVYDVMFEHVGQINKDLIGSYNFKPELHQHLNSCFV